MSRVFGIVVAARGKLYEKGILAVHRLPHPVISVGNLTTGGTGKTPLVLLLAETLRDQGFRPVVLSRGYRRQGSGVVIVSKGNGPVVPWEVSGDEPYLIAQRAAGVAVVVGADRFEAGSRAEKEDLGNLFLLDDGFQHRRLFRNVDLVTIDPKEWAAGEHLLPLGTWREAKAALSRSHAAIVQAGGPPVQDLQIPSFAIETVVDGIYRGCNAVPTETLKNQSITAFAGIAKPQRFFETLQTLGISVERTVIFRDHHQYSAPDLAGLGDGIKLTTEKDALKLEGRGVENVLHLRISARMPDIEGVLRLIRARL